MSYKYSETKGRMLSEMTADEQEYIRKKWDRLCARETVNTSECVFIQRPDGRFFKATRGRFAVVNGGLYRGSTGGYWIVRYGNCKRWGFKKDPFGTYYPDVVEKCFSGLTLATGETISVPNSVHTKKEVLALARKLKFEL